MTDTSALARQLGGALGDGYVVEQPLGEGGFAVVFLVRDVALKRSLAVKVLSPDMITSKTVLDRFRREAETVAKLSHPNIVPLFFIGQRDGLLYLAMQCVDGDSIADRLKREGKLPIDDAVRVAGEVASALAHAHKRGVIHRDIKPANVLIDAESGRSLVTDFGIARTAEASNLTATGMILGTPAYLSPEQVTGESSDHRVDIYALGVMTYEMLTGRLPFEGATPTAAMMKRLGGPPEPASTLRPETPPNVSEAIARALAADPAERFENALEFLRALDGEMITTGGHVTKAIPATRRPARLMPWIAGVAFFAGVGAVGFWTTRSSGPTTTTDNSDVVRISAGEYIIGSDRGAAFARPRHAAHVDAFWIERTEVTVGAYEKYVIATNASPPWTGPTPAATLPVTRVPWGDARNYCAWRYSSGRLPTENEWEAAARGREGRVYPYGSIAEPATANTASARRTGPAPVGSFPRGVTPEKLQDMSGNVWEWTSSSMHAYPGATPFADSMSQFRVIRGGAFDTPDSIATGWMRGFARAAALPSDLPTTGFRCAME